MQKKLNAKLHECKCMQGARKDTEEDFLEKKRSSNAILKKKRGLNANF